MNASPGVIDELLTLKNIQAGEHLIKSLNGAYTYIKNNGDVEIGTPKLHRLHLSSKDGALFTATERIKASVGGNHLYLGPLSPLDNEDTRTHQIFRMYEHTDESQFLEHEDDDVILDKVLNNEMSTLEVKDTNPIYLTQRGHVLSEHGDVKEDEVDGTELFQEDIMSKEDVTVIERLSKGGRRSFRSSSGGQVTEVSFSPSSVEIAQETESGSKVEMVMADGTMRIKTGDKEYDLLPMLKWFYEERGDLS